MDKNDSYLKNQIQNIGWLTTVPENLGGAGLDYLTYAIATEVMSEGMSVLVNNSP